MFVDFLTESIRPLNCVRVEELINFETVVQSFLNMFLYGILFFDLHLTTHQSNNGSPIKKSN